MTFRHFYCKKSHSYSEVDNTSDMVPHFIQIPFLSLRSTYVPVHFNRTKMTWPRIKQSSWKTSTNPVPVHMRRHVGIKLFTKIIWNNLIVSNHKWTLFWLISSHEALSCNGLKPWFCYSNQHFTKRIPWNFNKFMVLNNTFYGSWF
jgi:hypothetical protein